MQTTDKHGPAVDDAMKDPRVEAPSGYRHEGRPEEDDGAAPGAAGVARPDVPGGPGVPNPRTIETRADLARFVRPSSLPGGREEILAAAVEDDAPEWVRRSLAVLPRDRTFATFEEIWEALSASAA
jgi:hypothetical protein